MMTKALLKKQMLEVFSWLYKDRKTGKMRSAQGILMYVILYLFIFVSLGASFFPVAQLLCGPLVGAQMGWVYWCLLGLTVSGCGRQCVQYIHHTVSGKGQ